MDLLFPAILLFLISLVWTLAIFFIFKKIIGFQIKRDKIMLFGGLFFFILMIVVVVAGTVAFEYVESPQFCGTFCHIMEPYYDSYLYPGNNSKMAIHMTNETGCSNCHEEPGFVGKIGGLLRAIPEAYLYYTNTYNPNDLGGYVSREMCLKCHDGETATFPRYITTADYTVINPHADNKLCTECHNFHSVGFGLNENTCSLCHGTLYDNFEKMLSDHSERAGSDCMSCHNRIHPNDTLIPFIEYPTPINTDFCSDCHKDVVERLNNESHESESCMECHNEHSALLTIDYNNCANSCHIPPTDHDTTKSHCSVCHNSSTIHLKPGVDLGESFSDIICSNCHAAENSAYESSFTPESLKIYGDKGCIDCHSDHKTSTNPHLISSPFDDCGSCHSTYNQPSTIHNRTGISYLNFLGITEDFCSDCHSEEVLRLNRELHNAFECTDCHKDHNALIIINFNNCADSCHSPPADHDTSLTSCSGSECHDDLRSIHSKI